MSDLPECTCPSPACEFPHEHISSWFQLTYASYLVLPRSLMEAMPTEWQKRMKDCLDEMQATFEQENDNYLVLLRGEGGKFMTDPLGNYRRADMRYINSIRKDGE